MLRPYTKVFDTECVRNFWLLKFKDIHTGKIDTFAMWPGNEQLDLAGILTILQTSTIVGFNSSHYDLPMIAYALNGATCSELKDLNDRIIPGSGVQGLKAWDVESMYGITVAPLFLDHIDLYDVAPGVRISLKTYMGCIHSKKMQDLPFDPAASFSVMDRVMTMAYCENDLQGTQDLYKELSNRIALRRALNVQYASDNPRYPFDVRSKSDAQIAEAVFKRKLTRYLQPRIVQNGYAFTYDAPDFIKFKSQELNDILHTVQTSSFSVWDKDQDNDDDEDDETIVGKEKLKTGIRMPIEIKRIRYKRGESSYKFGMGGLHSQEKAKYHYTLHDRHELCDRDVKSYYPSLILLLGIYPSAIGIEFLLIYKAIYDERIEAKAKASYFKKMGDKVQAEYWATIADGLKIVLNGTFGKLASKWSVLFEPEALIKITLTGQLALLMLIERLEDAGIAVVSANTDGIVTRCPEGLQWLRERIFTQWEHDTGLETEATFYKAIFSQSVNSYFAVTMDGEIKTKGLFAEPGIHGISTKLPARTICKDAAIAYLTEGVPIEETIATCQDIRRFVTIRNVKGGGVKRRFTTMQQVIKGTEAEPFEFNADVTEWLGKVVRYVYKLGEIGNIEYKSNGNQVSNTLGAEPMMELADSVPTWIDRNKYVEEAKKVVASVGVTI